MANLSSLIVSGSTRLLNKLYCKDIDIDGIISGNLSVISPISSSIKSTSYLNAARGTVIINGTASAGYNMLFRQKSTNGVFTGGAYNDKYYFYYIADSLISAGTNSYTKQLCILDESGNSNFPGTVTAPTFSGSLNGLATKATQDSSGQQITSTYLKNVTVSGKTVTFTRGDNTTFTITTQDTNTTYPVAGKTINASFATAYRTQTKGAYNNGDYISMIRNDTANVANSPQYGSGLSWGRGDTHGYLYLSHNKENAYVGAGNQDKLNWVKELAYYDQFTSLASVKTVTATSAGWSASAPYTQTITVSGITSSDNPIVGLYIPTDTTAANEKLIKKAYSCLSSGVTNNGSITLYCMSKKPTTNFQIFIKGV